MFFKILITLLSLTIPHTSLAKLFTHHISQGPGLRAIPTNPNLRFSSYPHLSGDTFRKFCNFIIDETQIPFDSEKLFDGATIFVSTDYINYFFMFVHPYLSKKYILVTHNGDEEIPGKFFSYLNDKKLVYWFGQNVTSDSDKMIPIPIGIANPHWPHGNIDRLKNIISTPNIQKKYLLYLNIAHTHHERQLVAKIFSSKPFCFKASRKRFQDYLVELKQSHFVVCPRGNGLDCHRTWETLYCGSIPILKHSPLDPLFEGLPVILINNWEEITEEFLQKKLSELSNQVFNLEKIYADYWLNLISEAQRKISQ